MWLERIRAFTRTSIWRFTLIFTVIVLFICIGMLTLVYQFTIGEQQRQLTQETLIMGQGFSDLASTTNLNEAEFQQIIKSRIETSTTLILALKTSSGVIGNLVFQPKKVTTFPKLQRFPIAIIDHIGETSLVVVLGGKINTKFGDLVIGLLDDNYDTQEAMFYSASIISLSLALFITLIIGFILNRRVLLRVNQIGQLTASVKAGRLKTRLPLSRYNDEFDTIALQINQMLDEIDSLVDSVAQVTDNVAHDLRTPLSHIRISVEESLNNCITGSDDELWRLNLIESLDNVIETFNAMLELSRLEKGVQKLSLTEINIETLCEDIIEFALPIAESKEQTLSFITDKNNIENNVFIKGEANLLFRALFNIVENAMKYTQVEGTISLTVVCVEEAIKIMIADNGPGISEDEFDSVFQRLYQVDASRHSEGFGLGLPIVKAIVDLHNGKIKLSSAEPGLIVAITLEQLG